MDSLAERLAEGFDLLFRREATERHADGCRCPRRCLPHRRQDVRRLEGACAAGAARRDSKAHEIEAYE